MFQATCYCYIEKWRSTSTPPPTSGHKGFQISKSIIPTLFCKALSQD